MPDASTHMQLVSTKLPHVTHLDTFLWNATAAAYLNDSHLALLKGLRHLGCNGLDLKEEGTCLPHLTSLEVGRAPFDFPPLIHTQAP
jgi:hypothetical protein